MPVLPPSYLSLQMYSILRHPQKAIQTLFEISHNGGSNSNKCGLFALIVFVFGVCSEAAQECREKKNIKNLYQIHFDETNKSKLS